MTKPAWVPSLPGIAAETLAVLAGTVIAAFIVSKFPRLKEFVLSNAVVIRDQTGGPFL